MARCSLDQLIAFSAVAEHGSFSQAARAIGKDRATLHHQVGDLEIDWGIPLFDRSARLPRLTEEGKSLLRQSKHILYQIDSMELSCDQAVKGIESEITLIHDVAIPAEAIRSVEENIYLQFPHVQIHWLHRNREEALAALKEGEADFAITLNAGKILPSAGVKFLNLGYLDFAFFAHKDAPLAKKKTVIFTDLEKERQYIAENFFDSRMGNDLIISSQANRISNNDVLLALLKNGGYSLLPCHLVESEIYRGQYKKLDLDIMVQSGQVGFVLLYRSKVNQSALFTLIVESIKEQFLEI